MSAFAKLGLVAGGGDIAVAVAEHCRTLGLPYFVARIEPFADPRLQDHPGAGFGLGEIDGRFKALKQAGCDAVTLVGSVQRPDFSQLKLDFKGALLLPKVLAAARHGDDALLSVLLAAFEQEGFAVFGVEQVMSELTARPGPIGAFTPDSVHLSDITKAARIASAIGALDIGQGCVVCRGLVLAVEAQEGTDAMLERVARLPEALRGSEVARAGVLVKRPKPQQERRIDLPTVGLATVQRAAAAGLAGIAIEAGGALVVELAAVRAAADATGLFVYGFDADAA